MLIEFEDHHENFRRIVIGGRLDISGTDAIATKFSALTASAQRGVVVDLIAVSFLASIGIRALVAGAKALHQRGSKMVLVVGNNELVAKTLKTTGIDALMPIVADTETAAKALLA